MITRNFARPGASRRRARSAGLTLLELMFAMTLMVIGLLGFAQVLMIATSSATSAREESMAANGAAEMLKTIQSAGFVQIFGLYNGTPADDPGGVGTAPGKDFAIAGLNAAANDPDGLPGEILFPVQAGAPGALREDLVDARFGTPRDLDLDGAIDNANHAANYTLIPVVVRVRWRGTRGIGVYELKTMIANLP
ncbi:MAG: prepilin-type N-terminal cleavage/methylation domain-containing protein [Planctomycetes bacterium]|nr:prepilin-type N-terminal cleavage/methylation domain-containing protein [Planctomycetota bacterium]